MSGVEVKSRGQRRRGWREVYHWQVEDGRLDPFEFRVMLWLVGHDDRYRSEQASLTEAARRLGMSAGKVSKVLGKLTALGLIDVERGARGRLIITVDLDVWDTPPDDSRFHHVNGEPSPRETCEAPHLPLVENQLENPPRAPRADVDRRRQRVEAEGARVEQLFEAFWQAYPRKVGKPAARRAFIAAVKRCPDVKVMGAGLRVWVAYWAARGEPEFIPHPSTWLNQQRWNDAPPAVAAVKQPPLTPMQRAWLRQHPGASEADARAASAAHHARAGTIEATVS